MKIIAHRGLLNGKDEKLENRPDTFKKALEAGFDVEVDVDCDSGTKKAPEPNFWGKYCRQKSLGKFWTMGGQKKVWMFRVCSLNFS